VTETELRNLKRKAIEIRRLTLEEIAHLGIGHLGGSMSVVEILVYLYDRVLNVYPADPHNNGRDKFVMSKGHAGPALYAVLADMGFFPKEWLMTLNEGGTNLPSHCDMNRTPGIDMTTGSLGQGLSAAVGIALGHRIQELPGRVFALLSDGDINEGQTWEAAMSAAMFGIGSLVAFIDYNKMQIDGVADDIMRTDRQVERWSAFGWYAQQADGHDFQAIEEVTNRALAEKHRPSIVVLHTIKGKGMPFCEGDYRNHNMPVSREQAQEALASLRAEEEALV
jgi:transketolase